MKAKSVAMKASSAMKVKQFAKKASKAPSSLADVLKAYKRAGKTRGAFTTKAYYDGSYASLRRGDDAATANARAKAAHRRAAALWDSSR